MPVAEVYIDGVQRSFDEGTFEITERINARGTLHGVLRSEDGTVRADASDPVAIVEDSITIFTGVIETPVESGIGGIGGAGIVTDIVAVDNNELAERRFVTANIPAGTLKSFLQVLEPYLTDYGVVLDPAQVPGPTLPALSAVNVKLSDVLNNMSSMSGDDFLWEIDYDLKLRMFQPGTVAAPFNITQGAVNTVNGDVTVSRQRSTRVNRVIVRMGTGPTPVEITDVFTGNGVLATFQLSFPITGPQPMHSPPSAVGNAFLTLSGGRGTESVGDDELPSPLLWDYSRELYQITRNSGPLPSGITATIKYNTTFPVDVVVEDLADQAVNGIFEKLVGAPTVYDRGAATAIGQAELDRGLSNPVTVKYATNRTGLHPGQTQTITLPIRNLSGSFLITEVVTRHAEGLETVREVTAVGGLRLPSRLWQTTVTNWSGGVTSAPGNYVPGSCCEVMVDTVVITHPEILMLDTDPVIVVPAPGPGFALVPVHAVTSQQFMAAYDQSTYWQFRYGDETGPQFSMVFGGSPTPSMDLNAFLLRPAVDLDLNIADVENLPLVVSCDAISTGGHAGNRLIASVAYYIVPLAGQGVGEVTLIAHASAGNTVGTGGEVGSYADTGDGPEGAIDTSDADTLFIAASNFADVPEPTDSEGNVWDLVDSYISTHGAKIYLWRAQSPVIVSATHTARATTPSFDGEPVVSFVAFSGVSESVDAVQKLGTTSTGTLTVPAITPSANGALILAPLGFAGDTDVDTPPGFTLLHQVQYTSQHRGIALAYMIQATAASQSVEWTPSNAVATAMSGLNMAFLPVS